ncbi:MAG TPA: hypothetical protein PKX92_13065, partial [Edaphocola sp.]|nr:hypothetical protein [Edaphocola sp.]
MIDKTIGQTLDGFFYGIAQFAADGTARFQPFLMVFFNDTFCSPIYLFGHTASVQHPVKNHEIGI